MVSTLKSHWWLEVTAELSAPAPNSSCRGIISLQRQMIGLREDLRVSHQEQAKRRDCLRYPGHLDYMSGNTQLRQLDESMVVVLDHTASIKGRNSCVVVTLGHLVRLPFIA